jgi:hypothetical protein
MGDGAHRDRVAIDPACGSDVHRPTVQLELYAPLVEGVRSVAKTDLIQVSACSTDFPRETPAPKVEICIHKDWGRVAAESRDIQPPNRSTIDPQLELWFQLEAACHRQHAGAGVGHCSKGPGATPKLDLGEPGSEQSASVSSGMDGDARGQVSARWIESLTHKLHTQIARPGPKQTPHQCR